MVSTHTKSEIFRGWEASYWNEQPKKKTQKRNPTIATCPKWVTRWWLNQSIWTNMIFLNWIMISPNVRGGNKKSLRAQHLGEFLAAMFFESFPLRCEVGEVTSPMCLFFPKLQAWLGSAMHPPPYGCFLEFFNAWVRNRLQKFRSNGFTLPLIIMEVKNWSLQ